MAKEQNAAPKAAPAAVANGFELEQVETRLEFGLYGWIDEHCDVNDSPGVGCNW